MQNPEKIGNNPQDKPFGKLRASPGAFGLGRTPYDAGGIARAVGFRKRIKGT
jgi:hypothetical protein